MKKTTYIILGLCIGTVLCEFLGTAIVSTTKHKNTWSNTAQYFDGPDITTSMPEFTSINVYVDSVFDNSYYLHYGDDFMVIIQRADSCSVTCSEDWGDQLVCEVDDNGALNVCILPDYDNDYGRIYIDGNPIVINCTAPDSIDFNINTSLVIRGFSQSDLSVRSTTGASFAECQIDRITSPTVYSSWANFSFSDSCNVNELTIGDLNEIHVFTDDNSAIGTLNVYGTTSAEETKIWFDKANIGKINWVPVSESSLNCVINSKATITLEK